MTPPPEDDPSFDLFTSAPPSASAAPDAHQSWPDPARFPLNERGAAATVIEADLRAAQEPFIVSGYASLDRMLDFVAALPRGRPARILLGHEPYPSRRTEFRLDHANLGREIERYWLERGVSPALSAQLLLVIDALRSERLRVRIIEGRRALHAKVYVSDQAVTLGSSNFSESGMRLQMEVNARFERDSDAPRYEEVVQIAENLWASGADFGERLIALLERLLCPTDWQLTLARACCELLEGEWAERWLRQGLLDDSASLWPSQRQGIAQALYVLSRQGSVLVADATGSGKTRLGVHLVGATLTEIARSGRLRQGRATMICPPLVKENWSRESRRAGIPLEVVSHGKLSHGGARDHEEVVEALRRAQVLCVDEGHNFLNVGSNRSQQVLRNLADHVLLFTATPLNRSPADLLRIADMLGADNLSPSILAAFERMLGARNVTRTLSHDEIELLRAEIQRFTVRRTKPMLHALVEREPEAYVDASGRPCRFPQHSARTYALGETTEARAIASRISDIADALLGVTHFRKTLEMPAALKRQGVAEATYLDVRLRSANRLSRHQVMSSLRSSRAALMEHLIGTEAAVKQMNLSGFSKAQGTGDVLGLLERIAGQCPKSKLQVELPEWLSDERAHRDACSADAERYREILGLLERLDDGRESAKARKLLELTRDHALLLAFDARPITLFVIGQRIKQLDDRAETVIATGDRGSDRARALEAFARGSEAKGLIGLCSDSLSEGVNLQQASAIVHLDMPSVVRIAEQRVGRVDRLDSPHDTVEAWWPDDAPEFALTADERFIERYETVERLLGANMPLPEHLATEAKPISADEQIAAAEEASAAGPWDGIEDAFAPVRSLTEGARALVDASTYAQAREQLGRIACHLSVVEAATPWLFVCLRSGAFDAPRWLLLEEHTASDVTELSSVVEALRARLRDGVRTLQLDESASALQQSFLARLPEFERTLLPRRKLRALEELEAVTAALIGAASLGTWTSTHDRLNRLHALLTHRVAEAPVDWDEMATRYLDLVRPVWFEQLTRPRRRRPLQLRDVREAMIEQGDELAERLVELFAELPHQPSLESRISACILGMPEGS